MDDSAQEILRRIEDRAALLRHWADCAALQEDRADRGGISGAADALGDVQGWPRAARQSLIGKAGWTRTRP